MRHTDVRLPLTAVLLIALITACGDLQSGQAAVRPSATVSVTTTAARSDCVALGKTIPTTVPPLIVSELGNGTKRVTSAEGGYTIVAPSAWLVTASFAGGIEPQFAQVHFSSFDQRAAPTSRPEAGGMLPPEVGIHLDLELWWNPDQLASERYAQNVHIGPDQLAAVPGAPVIVAGQQAYRFTIQDERRFQPTNAPLIAVRQTRAVWVVPTLRGDRMLVIAATPAESDLLSVVERAVSTLAIAPGVRAERPVTVQRSDILKQWRLDKTGAPVPGRRVEAKLLTYADASAAMNAPHTGDQNGPSTGGGSGSRAIPRIDHDPDALYWVVVVAGPGLPQGRGGPLGVSSPAPTAWIFYDTPATSESGSGTGSQYAGAGPSTPAWPLGFDTLPDLCR